MTSTTYTAREAAEAQVAVAARGLQEARDAVARALDHQARIWVAVTGDPRQDPDKLSYAEIGHIAGYNRQHVIHTVKAARQKEAS